VPRCLAAASASAAAGQHGSGAAGRGKPPGTWLPTVVFPFPSFSPAPCRRASRAPPQLLRVAAVPLHTPLPAASTCPHPPAPLPAAPLPSPCPPPPLNNPHPCQLPSPAPHPSTPPPPPLHKQLLRVEHPAPKYTKVHGGAVEVEAEPSKLRFFDRERGGRAGGVACGCLCLCLCLGVGRAQRPAAAQPHARPGRGLRCGAVPGGGAGSVQQCARRCACRSMRACCH
jgi:hypothetical protein